MRQLAALLLIAVPLLAGDARITAAVPGRSSLEGTWKVLAVESDGRQIEGNAGYSSILIYDDKIVFNNLRFEARTLTYRLDPSAVPARFDCYDEQGKKLIVPGIYELRGDSLRLCRGTPRPTALATRNGDGRILFICQRQAR